MKTISESIILFRDLAQKLTVAANHMENGNYIDMAPWEDDWEAWRVRHKVDYMVGQYAITDTRNICTCIEKQIGWGGIQTTQSSDCPVHGHKLHGNEISSDSFIETQLKL